MPLTYLRVSKYVAVDAYFSKKSFIDSVNQVGLHLVTRMRNDAVMYYAYTGPQRTGRGRKRQFAGKIDVRNLDVSQFRACIQEQTWTAFEGVAYAKALKKWVKTVIVQNYKADGNIKNCKIFIATDLTMTGADLYLYYHLRFQIEFIYRDAKQHLGLTIVNQLNNKGLIFIARATPYNFALTMLSVAKVVHWLSKPLENRKPFSIQDIKAQYFNERFLNLFFNVFGICPEQRENNLKIESLTNYAKLLPNP